VETGAPISGLPDAERDGALVFHAATRPTEDGGWATAGGRVVTVVGRGATLEDAARIADEAADRIRWPGVQRRRDIGVSAVASGAAR
jgi:phosphoribosylamine--glycine ligase